MVLFTGIYFFAILGLLSFCILLFSIVIEMTNHSIVMLRRLQSSKTFVCVYKILCFCANPQKFQTLVPAKNSHLKGMCILPPTVQGGGAGQVFHSGCDH